MPAKNVVRNFAENSYYHVFNRGVEKRLIFLDDQDYSMFLYYLKVYLLPLEEISQRYPNLPLRLQSKNLSTEVELVSYCLMPNHFHLLIKQMSVNGVPKLLKQVSNAYTFYFNSKYNRVGGLMQGRYKAVVITTDEQLLHLSRYIHLNPMVANLVSRLEDFKWSSYKGYIDTPDRLINNQIILDDFQTPSAYKDFIMDHIGYARELDKIKHLTLDLSD